MIIPPEFSGLPNLEKLLPSEPSSNINCHKAVLYLAGIISFEELVSDPRKKQDEDFTFRRRALEISHKHFRPISNTTDLVQMAENEIPEGEILIGQILDVQNKEWKVPLSSDKNSKILLV
jgi:hypothetical protein